MSTKRLDWTFKRSFNVKYLFNRSFSGLSGESLKLKTIVVVGKATVEKQDLNPRFWWRADLQTSHFTALKRRTASFLGTKDKHRAAAMFQSLSAPSHPQLLTPRHTPATHGALVTPDRYRCYLPVRQCNRGCLATPPQRPPPTLLPPVPCEVTQRARSQQSQHVVWVSVSETSPPYVGLCV